MPSAKGWMISEDEIVIVVPLTLGLNQLNKMPWQQRHRYRKQQGNAVKASLIQIFGGRIPKPWAKQVEMRAVRCIDHHRRLDEVNAIGGMKQTEDGIVTSGLIPDDSERHVHWGAMVEQRVKGQWGDLAGPATYVWIRRIK